MPQYTLKLRWTAQGADPHHPHSVAHRRAQAIAAARRNRVTAWDGSPIDLKDITSDGDGATWKVAGADADICGMISTWTWFRNVTVSGGPHCRP
jgi:hypothetical protein